MKRLENYDFIRIPDGTIGTGGGTHCAPTQTKVAVGRIKDYEDLERIHPNSHGLCSLWQLGNPIP